VAELVQEPNIALSPPLRWRARLVRLMKTAKALLERTSEPRANRLAQMLVDQLIAIMPELSDVQPWNAIGSRRRRDEFGWAFLNRLSARDFFDADETP
jgi:hypothetical protein